ncbi:MAG: YicC family protein [Verrucomicrobia bacterium]|nr:YicC family protein [Verrucomicrobiota bacterium]
MAIKSMTGFGAGSARAAGVQIAVELSSVNRKQLEVVLRLPQQLAPFEVQAQKIIQNALSRGRISGTVQLEMPAGEMVVAVDQKRAAAVVETLRSSAKKLKLEDDLSASMLLKIPNLLDFQRLEKNMQAGSSGFQCLEKALNAALKKLVAMRSLEGRALADDLSARLNGLEAMLHEIEKRAPQVLSNHRNKMFQGLEKLGIENLAQDERVLKEIALFGEKSDIAEEITRLTSHIKQFRASLRSAEPVGRELDFLLQEFLREINTIGSKANDLEITRQVVAFKTELERIREQVQNVE